MWFRTLLLLLASTPWLVPARAQTPTVNQDSAAIAAFNRMHTLGNGPAAVAYLERYVLDRPSAQAPSAELGEVYHQLASAYFPQEMDKAAGYLNEALELRASIPGVSAREQAESAFLSAQFHYQLQQFRQGLTMAELSLNLFEESVAGGKTEASLGSEIARNQLLAGLFAFALRDYALALRYFRKADNQDRRFPNPRTRMMITNQMAMVSIQQQDYEGAVEAYLTANALHKKQTGAESPSYLNNVATTYAQIGDAARADRYYDRALKIARGLPNTMGSANPWVEYFQTLLLKGRHLYLTGRFDRLTDLAPLLEQHPEGAEEPIQRGVLGELYQFIGNAYAQVGNFEAARAALQLSAESLLDPLRLEAGSGLPVVEGTHAYRSSTAFVRLLEAHSTLNRLMAEANDGNSLAHLRVASMAIAKIDSLHRRNREGLRLTESVNMNNEAERLYVEEGIKVALDKYALSEEAEDRWEAYRYAAGSKSLTLRQFMGLNSLTGRLGVSANLTERKLHLDVRQQSLEKQLGNTSGDEVAPLRDSLLAVSQRNMALRDELVERYPLLGTALRENITFTERELRERLPEDQMVVEYFRGDSTLYIFTVTAAQGVRVTRAAVPDSITDLAARALQDTEASRLLYDQLIQPVIAQMPTGINRLQFIPDAELWPVPFAALTDADGSLVIERYAVSYTYSVKLIYDATAGGSEAEYERAYLGFGISYEGILDGLAQSDVRSAADRDLRNMGKLPYASQEVSTAADLTGGVAFLDREATKANFLRFGSTSSILHLAMHGFLDDNPMETSLVFSSSDTATYETFSVREVLEHRFPTALTVLSACHTGSGPVESSEGMQSIGRAFTAAGSEATITSNWEANDQVTHDILLSFYEHLRSGVPKDVSLQRAVQAYLDNATPAERQPRRWANLVVNGSVRPLPAQAGFGRLAWWLIVLGVAAGLVFGGWRWMARTNA